MLEVEIKFRVPDPNAVERGLVQLGARFGASHEQVDRYFAHPARDFAQTDEALRMRLSEGSWCVTYKGPKLDRQTKTRREIELPLAGGEAGAAQFAELLEALGFRPVLEVRKLRREARVTWQEAEITAALDRVDRVGEFVELEILSSERDLDANRARVMSLAAHLGLTETERRSYLELLLEAEEV
ncbi:MAG: class IV adenylate cyclase [Pirellulales bacterium]|nr:class IV adenylate cyclase [Pirellulales bacterium]